jgi:hypothetical protein
MLYPGTVESERAAEITEGLAQYTGTVLAADTTADAIASALDQLVEAETQDSFVRTFAYASGPAYGLLLDATSSGWTRRGARHRRPRHARDACARCSASH